MNSTAIGLIVDGLDGSANILKFGFHYTIAGFEVYLGEILLASSILILFGILNILGVKKAAFVQTVLSVLLVGSVFTMAIVALCSSKATLDTIDTIWGFDKTAAMLNGATTENIGQYAHTGTKGVISAILATFAIAPWAYVGFDTIPQAAEEFKFSYRKVIGIMVLAIVFGCFVYSTNNLVSAAALQNWPDRVMAGEWVLLAAAEEMMGVFGKILIGVAVSCAVLSGIMGFYLASSRLLYSMAQDGYMPSIFGKINPRYGTPSNAIVFCIIISLSGPVLGREALGWFLDMSAIGASMGYFFTCLSTVKKMNQSGEHNPLIKTLAIIGTGFSVMFMILQLIPIPGLEGVHFGKESYILLLVWIAIGVVFAAVCRRKKV
jgi:amino acid transporter